DLAVTSYATARVAVLLGDGTGHFSAPTLYSVGSKPMSGAIADFNGDNKPDLVVANYGGTTGSVLLNNGDGTFAAAGGYSTGAGSNPEAVRVADVNNDSKLDLITANTGTNSIGVLLGNGAGAFGAVATFGSGGMFPQSLAVADLDGTNGPDVVVSNSLSN